MITALLRRIVTASLLVGVMGVLSDQALGAAPSIPMQCEPACPSRTLPEPSAAESVQALQLKNIIASRPGDQRAYVLLGSGFLRALSSGDPKVFITDWVAEHPKATFEVISADYFTNIRTRMRSEIDYIWVKDGNHALNVELVRNGIFQGATMFDMVDNARGLNRLLQTDPRLADARANMARERAAAPEDRAERLVSESVYKARLLQVEDAERRARAEKLGIWSDSMKEEREAEGIS
jgi:hypothetical protein